jgi:hypothetical protein
MALVLDYITGRTSSCLAQTALVLRREKPLTILHLTAHDKGLLFYMDFFHHHLLVMSDERVIGLNRACITLIVETDTKRFTGAALHLKRVLGIFWGKQS